MTWSCRQTDKSPSYSLRVMPYHFSAYPCHSGLVEAGHNTRDIHLCASRSVFKAGSAVLCRASGLPSLLPHILEHRSIDKPIACFHVCT